MIKATLLVILMAGLYLTAHSQTVDEWFRQEKTQKRYLLQQLAALRVFGDALSSGFRIAKGGIDTIFQTKTADYGLHKNFNESHRRVGEGVKRYQKIAAIVSYATKISSQAQGTIREARSAKQLTPDEVSHCTKLLQTLLGECGKMIEDLTSIITPGQREMRDEQRIRRIDEIYEEVQRQYSFCLAFSNSMALLSRQRAAEQIDINRSKTINGLQ